MSEWGNCAAPWCTDPHCLFDLANLGDDTERYGVRERDWRLRCRCQGSFGTAHCWRRASGEDGLCDPCRATPCPLVLTP